MALTPETLPRHELNGLPVRVVESDDPTRVGIEGRVVVETTNTLHVEVRVPPAAERKRGGREARSASSDSSGPSPREGAATRRNAGDFRVVTVPKSGSVFEFAITDDAADFEKESGTTSKLTGARSGVNGISPFDPDSAVAAGDAGGDTRASRHASEDVAYVTVDGSRLLSRPARRTETSSDSPWQ